MLLRNNNCNIYTFFGSLGHCVTSEGFLYQLNAPGKIQFQQVYLVY